MPVRASSPPDGKLSDAEIDALTQWVVRGLPWPPEADQPAVEPAAGEGFKITDEQRRFWAFQPLAYVEPPAVANSSWPAGMIDRFILAKLEAAGMQPAEAADRRSLVRRATFDLTGLPPTAEAVDAFVNDPSPDAFAKVVDRPKSIRAASSRRASVFLIAPGLCEWRGPSDIGPWLIANSNAEPISFLTIKMPARSVAVHPAPVAGVAVQWRAPQAGVFRVTGYVQDADGSCGNGVDWAVKMRKDAADSQLAGGAIDSGSRQDFGAAAANEPNALGEITLAAGDAVSLVVTNRGEQNCDSTLIDLTITEVASGRAWNLAQDVLTDPLEGGRGNPHRDAYAASAVWRFLDPAQSARRNSRR